MTDAATAERAAILCPKCGKVLATHVGDDYMVRHNKRAISFTGILKWIRCDRCGGYWPTTRRPLDDGEAGEESAVVGAS